MDGPIDLIARWKGEAQFYQRDELNSYAAICARHATDLEVWWRAHQSELLTLTEAAEESGYTADALAKQIKRGALNDAGGEGRPLVRRCDLPRKPGRPSLRSIPAGGPDVAGAVLAARERAGR